MDKSHNDDADNEDNVDVVAVVVVEYERGGGEAELLVPLIPLGRCCACVK